MNLIRRLSIVLTLVGAGLLFFDDKSDIPELPLPTKGLTVKGRVTVAADADYSVMVAMPKVGDRLGLDSETVPCSLTVKFSGDEKADATREIASLTRSSEDGFGRIQHYRAGDTFHLSRGFYTIEVTSRESCAAATERGAMISLQPEGNPTSRYFRTLIRHWLMLFSFCGGLLGLIASEFIRPKSAR